MGEWEGWESDTWTRTHCALCGRALPLCLPNDGFGPFLSDILPGDFPERGRDWRPALGLEPRQNSLSQVGLQVGWGWGDPLGVWASSGTPQQWRRGDSQSTPKHITSQLPRLVKEISVPYKAASPAGAGALNEPRGLGVVKLSPVEESRKENMVKK